MSKSRLSGRTIVKNTKTEEVCSFCGSTIPKGSQALKGYGTTDDGKACKRYACLDCEPHVDDFWDCVGSCESVDEEFARYCADKGIEHPRVGR